MLKLFVLFMTSLLTLSSYSSDDVWQGQGEVAVEWRRFENDSRKNSESTGLSLFSRIEASFEEEQSKHVFRGFGRVDKKDKDRNVLTIEDAYLSWFFDEDQTLKFLVGYKLFNWTATEAFHPADTINSRNYDSDLERLEKLGELTLEISKNYDQASFSFYYFPRFEPPVLPQQRSRLGGGVNLDSPQMVIGKNTGGRWAPQFGVRFSYTFDDSDFSMHGLRHIDRNFPIVGTSDYSFLPPLSIYTPNDIAGLLSAPTPYYFEVTEFGMTYAVTFGPMIFKFEGVHRNFEDQLPIYSASEEDLRKSVDHQEIAVGLEFPFSSDFGSETTFLLEFGGIFGVDKMARKELSVFQRDVFIGIRHAFNDTMGTEILLSSIVDIEREKEILYNFTLARRLSDTFKIKGGLRLYDAPNIDGDKAYGLESLDGANHVFLILSRFF